MEVNKIRAIVIILFLTVASAYGQRTPKPDYISNWDVYLDDNDPNHARSIVIDMGLIQVLPVPGYGKLGVLSITLNSPNPDGLPQGAEYKELVRVEDKMEQFASSAGIYSFRVASDGKWNFVYYLADTSSFRSGCNLLMSALPSYKYTISITNDPNWKKYLAHYPNVYQLQAMSNAAVLRALNEKGDKLLVARDVNHYAYFASVESRNQMEKEVKKMGFVIEQKNETWGEFTYALVFSRDDKVDQESIDKLTYILLDLTLKYGGEYDGWECLVVKD